MAALRVLPAEITVLAGRFGPFPAAQPLVFAHLGDVAPALDLDHVEVVPVEGAARLAAFLEEGTLAAVRQTAGDADTLVLVLPGAFEGLDPPPLASPLLRDLGAFRGLVRRHVGGAA